MSLVRWNRNAPHSSRWRVKADRAPDVVARLDGISGMVTPQAVIPFNCLIKDEFAVTDVQLNYEWKHEDNEADAGKDARPIDAAKGQLGQATVRIRDEQFDLAPLNIPVGSGLRLFISARDKTTSTAPTRGSRPSSCCGWSAKPKCAKS